MAMVNVIVRCCHVGYEYDSETGICMFMYHEQDDIILRMDYTTQKYIYVRVSVL